MSRQLSEVEGVVGVEVDFDTKTAVVQVVEGTDPDTVCDGLSGQFTGKVKQ